MRDSLAEEERKTCDAVKTLVILEREIERQKRNIVASCLDFNLYNAFRILDLQEKGFVT